MDTLDHSVFTEACAFRPGKVAQALCVSRRSPGAACKAAAMVLLQATQR